MNTNARRKFEDEESWGEMLTVNKEADDPPVRIEVRNCHTVKVDVRVTYGNGEVKEKAGGRLITLR